MDRIISKEEIEAQLRGKAEEISMRMDALQTEVTTIGEAVVEALKKNPVVSVFGAVAAGVVVGLVFGGGKKSEPSRPKLVERHRELIDRYVDAVVEEARETAAAGKDLGASIRRVLQERSPLIVVGGRAEESEESFIKNLIRMAVSAAVGMAVRTGVDYATQKINLNMIISGAGPGDDIRDADITVTATAEPQA